MLRNPESDMTTIEFFVGEYDGVWLAASRKEPYFCFQGATPEEVVETTQRALELYCSASGGGDTPNVQIKDSREVTAPPRFTPSKRVLAEAC
jgi:predicted RNase H-like HicB family nuclease